jgi:basic membrane lipoprotein Med (substrate-binding protein (PBP1-ABC) superfamily)
MGTGLVSERRLRVGLVVEPGGIDYAYSHGAYLGFERAVRELGIRGRVLTQAPKEGCVPSLSLLARQRYDLVIGIGVVATGGVAAPAIDKVATGSPKRGSRSSTSPTRIWRIAQKTSWASYSGKSKPATWPVTWLRSC